MGKLGFLLWVACVVFSGAVWAGPRPALVDIYGVDHFYDEFIDAQTEAVVYIILDENCPVVRQQIPKIKSLYQKYNSFEKDRAGQPKAYAKYPGDKVRFIGVYVKPDQSAKSVADHALSEAIPFRVLRDKNLEFVKSFGITRLSEVTVFDKKWNIVYQGPVDDQAVQGSAKVAPTNKYLEETLDSMLAQAPTRFSKVPAVGCVIDQARVRDYPKVTYHDHVAPIIKAKCQACHENGAVGPMPLTNYQEITDYASMIEEVIVEERMPPWPATSPLKLRKPLELSKSERETLIGWLRTGMPLGNPPKEEVAESNGQQPEWHIGQPDFVFQMPKAYQVPATGLIDYVYVPVEINGGKGFDEDKWIEAIQVKPGAPEVVHHIQVHEFRGKVLDGKIDPIQQLLLYGLSVENARLLGSYTPGNIEENARDYSSYLAGKGASAAMKLSRGTNLLLEMHYTPNGKATTDRSSVGIRFAKKPPDVALQSWFPFRKRPDMVIPANVENHSLQDKYHFGSHTGGRSILLHGMRPHMHSRGKSYRIEKIQATEVSDPELQDFSQHDRVRGETLLKLPVWDFNWQHFYRFEKPLLIKPNEALLATAYWDNTSHNPRNPDATVDVKWGQQTVQEMFNTLFIFEVLEPGDPRIPLLSRGGK